MGVAMKLHSICTLSVGAAMLFVLAGHAETRAPAGAHLRQFHQAIDTYTVLHRRLEQGLAPLRAGSSAQQIFEASDELAAALLAARPKAREGDIFTAETADVFRARIANALRVRGHSVDDVVAESQIEAPADAAMPVVNGRFPWLRGAGMWPCVLSALPSVPEELQYRIVGRNLVLVDVHANLVVDILRDALR
jgi:hypothetical protein